MAKLDRAWAHGAVHLMRASLAAALVSGAGACSVLYNPDNIDRDGGVPGPPADAPPGTPDAPPGTIDAAPPIDSVRVDATPGDLTLYRLVPGIVEEGMGTGRAIPVVIEGAYIAQGAMVRLTGLAQSPQMLPLTVSSDGTLAAFNLVVPVNTTRGETAADDVTVTVVQTGQPEESLTLNVDWLNELVASVYGASRNFTFDIATLNPRYSSITINANMGSAGQAPLRLVATSELVLAGVVTATGLDALGAMGGLPGPGGCAGGNETQAGLCTPGGGAGAAATVDGGGGGGGHAVTGSPGMGASPGQGGSATGNDAMTKLTEEGGNGGGGGGGAGSGPGGGGGGGGGVIELTSLGTFRIDSNGRLSVQGGKGAGCGGNNANGGGGGGSGGAVLLRSAQAIVGGASGTLLTVDGGQGGTTNCAGQGGNGARGRARVDAVTLPAAAGSASPFHGAVLDPATPTIVDTEVLSVTVRGGANKTYAVISPGTPTPQSVTLNGSGSGSKNVTLLPGANRVCVLMTQTDVLGSDDENCLDVAYVP